MHFSYPASVSRAAHDLLARLSKHSILVATAESCTGGLLSAALTERPGASALFERGFVTYSNAAKSEQLGVSPDLIARHGAVSIETAVAMAEGALNHSHAHLSIAVTGIAGPDGGSPEKPVGLVCFAALVRDRDVETYVARFGPIGRSEIRLASVEAGLRLGLTALDRE